MRQQFAQSVVHRKFFALGFGKKIKGDGGEGGGSDGGGGGGSGEGRLDPHITSLLCPASVDSKLLGTTRNQSIL